MKTVIALLISALMFVAAPAQAMTGKGGLEAHFLTSKCLKDNDTLVRVKVTNTEDDHTRKILWRAETASVIPGTTSREQNGYFLQPGESKIVRVHLDGDSKTRINIWRGWKDTNPLVFEGTKRSLICS